MASAPLFGTRHFRRFEVLLALSGDFLPRAAAALGRPREAGQFRRGTHVRVDVETEGDVHAPTLPSRG